MSNSKTVVDVQDSTDIHVEVDSGGRMHVLIGAEHEHQVEIVSSVPTLGYLASQIVDEMAGHTQALQNELARWVKTG